MFAHHDSRVVAQFPIELAGSDVDRVDAGGAALQETIGESTGGGADIEADFAGDLNAEMIERRLQLQSAASDIAWLLGQLDLRIRCDCVAGLVYLLAVDEDFASEYQRLCLFRGIPPDRARPKGRPAGGVVSLPGSSGAANDKVGQLAKSLGAIVKGT